MNTQISKSELKSLVNQAIKKHGKPFIDQMKSVGMLDAFLLKIKSEIPAAPVKVVKPTAPQKPRVYKRKPKPVVDIKHLFETDMGALLKHYRNTKTQDKRRSTILGKKVLKIKDNFTVLKNSFISFPIRTEKKIFGKSGVVITARPDSKPQCTENTIDIISQACSKLLNKENAYAKTKFPQGFRIFMKIAFVNHNDGQHYSVSIANDLTLNAIRNEIRNKMLYKNFDTMTYSIDFDHCVVFIFGLNSKGGCGNCTHIEEKIKYKNRTVKLISPKSTNDNCLFMCFAHFLNRKGNTVRCGVIRKHLKLDEGMVSFENVGRVAAYFKCNYVLINEKQEIISQYGLNNDEDNCLHIMLMKEHYYIVEYIEYEHCKLCNRKLRMDNTDHVCDPSRVTFRSSQILKKKEYVNIIKIKEKMKIDNSSMIFYDLETFQEVESHVPYACGYSIGDEEVVSIWGKDCMEPFIDVLLKEENKTICAYNGSGFDFYMLIDKLTARGIDIKNLILANGSILGFSFGQAGKENKCFDLCRFIMSSLDSACDAYKINNHKMKFDVLKVQSWETAELYKHEVLPYLKYDVLSLRELFFTFNDFIFEKESINITKFVTLSHMSYALWSSSLAHNIEIPDLVKYGFIKQGTYGARCYPQKKEYKSEHYDAVINKTMKYDELIKSGDYIFNADATSLYPASMSGFDLCPVAYPTGKSRWVEDVDECKKEFENKKCGYYTIEFKCVNKKMRVPVMPRKNLDQNNNMIGLEWSLTDGSGVYTSVDIESAISCGYEIKFIGKCLIWDTTGDVFGDYVGKYYQMKEDADNEKNDVKRSIAKLMLNAMYGKTLQRAIFEHTQIINNYQDLLNFMRDNKIVDINVMGESKLLMTGESLNKEARITKPSQLGGFVLAYSRKIMLMYMKAVDPTLERLNFTYSDTDSMHIKGSDVPKLIELGYIKSKDEAKLGYLCSDIKKEGVIIYEKNEAPKTYMYEYINNENQVADQECGVMKCKGIPKYDKSRPLYNTDGSLKLDKDGKMVYTKLLVADMYKIDDRKIEMVDKNNKPIIDKKTGKVIMTNTDICKVSFGGLKRKHKTLTQKDIESGVGHFSIVNSNQTRTFMNTSWKGMIFHENQWYPHGYEF